jgi:hypothetical protein
LGAQPGSIGVPSHEPKQLLNYTTPKYTFCRQKWKSAVPQIPSCLVAKFADDASSCAVSFVHTCFHDVPDDSQVLQLCVLISAQKPRTHPRGTRDNLSIDVKGAAAVSDVLERHALVMHHFR